MTESAPWDEGLQNERTGLAWQRTLLSGLACSLLIIRLVASVSLIVSLMVGGLALTCTGVLALIVLRRYHGHHQALMTQRPIGDGVLPAVAAALVTCTAAGAAAYVLSA